MRKVLAIVGSALALAALAPIASEAAGRMGTSSSRGQQGGSFRGQSFHQGQNFRGQNFHGHPFANNRSNFFRSRFRPNYYWPYYYPYYSSYDPSYFSAPQSYAPQQSYPGYSAVPYGYSAPSGSLELAPAPQIEREVVFAEGRYVLLGDGEATPFRWVWVPNPPTAPPSEPQEQR